LNCTMPELVKSSVGSLPGTSDDEGTWVCPFETKYSTNLRRISAAVMVPFRPGAAAGSLRAGKSKGWILLRHGRPGQARPAGRRAVAGASHPCVTRPGRALLAERMKASIRRDAHASPVRRAATGRADQ